jgi:uncharacterized protein
VRRIYDIHLKEFLQEWLEGGRFSGCIEDHLRLTDNEVLSGIAEAAIDAAARGHLEAARITRRQHFRVLYESNPDDLALNLSSVDAIYEAAKAQFGEQVLRRDRYNSEAASEDFPVRLRDGSIASSLTMSTTFSNRQGPSFQLDSIFVAVESKQKAKIWLEENKGKILSTSLNN